MYAANALSSLSPEEIRVVIVRRLEAALPGVDLVQRKGEPFRLTLAHPEAGELVLNLGNLVHEVLGATPNDAEDMVHSFVTLAQRAVAPPKVVLDAVYPGLRHRAYLEATGNRGTDSMIGEGPGDLLTVILADQGDGLATLSEAAVLAAGFSPEDVFAAAERNFVELLPEGVLVSSSDEGVVSLGLQDCPWLGSSLFFVPFLITRIMQERGWERALLAAPTRETVDLVDADEPGAIQVMERWMIERLAGPRTQSDVVFDFRQGDTEYRRSHLMAGNKLVRPN